MPWDCPATPRSRIPDEDSLTFPALNPIGIDLKRLPPNLSTDLIEAAACKVLNASSACVIMCRRVIQQVCDLHECKGNNLAERIDKLQIDSGLKRLAHKIRHFGNEGAHPDLLVGESVSPTDAETALRFTTKFLEYMYVLPSELEELDSKLESE